MLIWVVTVGISQPNQLERDGAHMYCYMRSPTSSEESTLARPYVYSLCHSVCWPIKAMLQASRKGRGSDAGGVPHRNILSLEQCDYYTIQEENGSITEYEYEHVALVHVRSHSEKFVCDSAYSAGHSVSLSLLTRLNSCFDDDATAQPRAVNILSRIIHLPPSRGKSYRSSTVTHTVQRSSNPPGIRYPSNGYYRSNQVKSRVGTTLRNFLPSFLRRNLSCNVVFAYSLTWALSWMMKEGSELVISRVFGTPGVRKGLRNHRNPHEPVTDVSSRSYTLL
ncbi:hypothetical protein ARMGADRAFT_105371 [Armillaria gallica]|uniref:Uncharacterized protein n=1 Tax=Armillaria gallica TaxID=47427 RepID=A0A2H3DZK7_ARMGA|nr:hypothetical protein ARMGADRAFT_105371 [Armillaria gallica]